MHGVNKILVGLSGIQELSRLECMQDNSDSEATETDEDAPPLHRHSDQCHTCGEEGDLLNCEVIVFFRLACCARIQMYAAARSHNVLDAFAERQWYCVGTRLHSGAACSVRGPRRGADRLLVLR